MAYMILARKAFERHREKRERLRKSVLDEVKGVLKRMHDEIPFEEAYIFGSVTKPSDFKEESDVDIAFLGLPKERLFESVAYLSRELLRDVDVIELERSRLKEKILKEAIRWKDL